MTSTPSSLRRIRMPLPSHTQQDLAALKQEAATALTLAQGEANTLAVRLIIVEQQPRNCLACHEPQDGDNHDKRPRTHAISTSAAPSGVNPPASAAGHRSSDYGTSTRSSSLPVHFHLIVDISCWSWTAQSLIPVPGQSTSAVRSQLFNNPGQPTIGQSPRPGTGVLMLHRSTTMQYCPWPSPSSRVEQST